MQNTMAEQNVPAQAPARTDEQIVPRSQWLQIRKSNLLFDAQKRTESETEAAAPKGDKEQGEVTSSTVTSGVGISVHTEDQAGSDPGKAHEALAGPDPEPMLKKDQTGSDS
ncbi:hypothetical protein Tco_0413333 [Tanacetum coccineum]